MEFCILNYVRTPYDSNVFRGSPAYSCRGTFVCAGGNVPEPLRSMGISGIPSILMEGHICLCRRKSPRTPTIQVYSGDPQHTRGGAHFLCRGKSPRTPTIHGHFRDPQHTRGGAHLFVPEEISPNPYDSRVFRGSPAYLWRGTFVCARGHNRQKLL
jgi:hypothetical protein